MDWCRRSRVNTKKQEAVPKGEYGISVLGDNNLLEVCSPGIDTRKYVNYIIGEANIKIFIANLKNLIRLLQINQEKWN